ncbi:MAG TPA: hypothetical protein VMU30_06445 [Bacteroidota bacterium]|nr:hypothetical protein [Bacteroidota bacterium]
MIYLAICLGYMVLLACLIRFFQTVHRWDDEIQEMEKQAHSEIQHRAA